LEVSWDYFGRLGQILDRIWGVLGASRESLEAFLDNLLESSAICANSEKPRKNHGFSLIFEVPGRFHGQTNGKNT
jgi:hypothetical protein